MTSARRPPRLIFLLSAAERRMRRWISARGVRHEVSAAGAGVLLLLAERPGATIGEVTDGLQASAAGASGLLARMERAGLITRAPDPDDRRSVRLELAPAGREALAEVRTALAELNGLLGDGFTDDELATVARWLEHTARVLR